MQIESQRLFPAHIKGNIFTKQSLRVVLLSFNYPHFEYEAGFTQKKLPPRRPGGQNKMKTGAIKIYHIRISEFVLNRSLP
ncbi:hypothetical protein DSECCO2_634450 [anaerobic digester metagenome]